jgi:hypothetical protein
VALVDCLLVILEFLLDHPIQSQLVAAALGQPQHRQQEQAVQILFLA